MKKPEAELTYKHQERQNEFLNLNNNSQRAALLLNPTLVKNCTCFGQINLHHQGFQYCIRNNWYLSY